MIDVDKEFWVEVRRALIILLIAVCRRWGLPSPLKDKD